MNVLSLFDGISCGQQALERQGIKVDNYFASEIDKNAIKVTMANYPDTIQLGSVVDVDVSALLPIQLIMAGSPCQSFSFAGKRKGMSTKDEIEIYTLEHYLELKSQNFEFEGQSYLFWEFIRILNDVRKYNPDVKFLLENVEMGEKWEKILSKAIGVNGIHINSALVSAQNRRRIYWTNMGLEPRGLFGDLTSIIQQPKDKGILLKDILEEEVDGKYFLSSNGINRIMGYNNSERSIDSNGKSLCLAAGYNKQGRDNQFIVASRGRNPENTSDRTKGAPNEQRLEPRTDGKTNCLTSVQKDNYVIQLNKSTESGGKQPYQQNRVYDANGISRALCANKSDLLICHNTMPRSSKTGKGGTGPLSRADGKTYCLDTGQTNAIEIVAQTDTVTSNIRRLTPIECCRLQTISDDYFYQDGKQIVSDSAMYKAIGNCWTIDVITHLLSYL